MAALGPISPITNCMREEARCELNNDVERPGAGGQGTHLVGADGDVGAVEEGVALHEVVGGEPVRGEGLAAGDGGVVRADVEAVAQAEEVVRRRCHAFRSSSRACTGRQGSQTMGRCRGRARASWGGRRIGGGPDLVSSRRRRGCYVTLLNVEKASWWWCPCVRPTYVCVSRLTSGGDDVRMGSAVWCFCIRISPRFYGFDPGKMNFKTAL